MLQGLKSKLTDPSAPPALLGAWSTTRDPVIAERLATTGFDYVCIDQQHGLMGPDSFMASMLAITGTGAEPVVRVPGNDAAEIGRALDAGACGVIVPMVEDAAQAARAVAACRYPPAGIRSFGPTRSHFGGSAGPTDINDSVACLVMIETLRGVENVRAIAGVSGVDGIYIGPADLALSFGYTPRAVPSDGPYAEALQEILTACLEAGITPGIHASSAQEARSFVAAGFRMVTVFTDIRLLQLAAAEQLRIARDEGEAG